MLINTPTKAEQQNELIILEALCVYSMLNSFVLVLYCIS